MCSLLLLIIMHWSFQWIEPGNTFIYLSIYLFILILFIFWLRWVFIAVRGLSLVVTGGSYSSLRCAGFSLWCLLLLWSTASRACGLQ